MTKTVDVVFDGPPGPGGGLTFAKAMALDPSEVECRFDEQWWLLNDTRLSATLTLRDLRISRFRRARPRRSLVQEINVRDWEDGAVTLRAMETIVRTVCEWLRAEKFNGPVWAAAIERHFLEPRWPAPPAPPAPPKPRLPVAGERVEYCNGFGSPLYAGTATGNPCGDNYCHAVHVLPDGREPPDIHHVPAGFFSRGAYQSTKWARVVVPSETAKGTK